MIKPQKIGLLVVMALFLAFGVAQRALAPYHGANPPPEPPQTPTTPSTQEVIVRIQGDTSGYGGAYFNPATVNVTGGTTVTWVNEDSMPHTVTSRDGLFDSPTLNRGQRFSYKFDKPGTYGYFCKIHPAMTGQVMVTGQAAAGHTLWAATLNSAQEIPAPRAETPREANGLAALVLNAARTELGFTLTYSGLSGPVTAMHFHRGKPGEAGPVVRTICPALGLACPTGTSATLSGIWKRDDAQALTPELIEALLNGELYLNIHTALNPPGEIRGQIKAIQP